MFTYFLLALTAVVFLIVVVNIVKSLIRGLKKSIGSLVAVIFSAIVALILTKTICSPGSSVVAALTNLLSSIDGAIAELFAIEELGTAVSYYSSMLVAPIFFTLAFIVVSIIVSIIVAIVIRFIPPFKKPNALANRLGGAGVGLVCGILVAILTVMPFVGTLDVVSASLSSDRETVEELAGSEVAQFVADAESSAAFDIFTNVGCSLLYNSLAQAKYEGEVVSLKNDIGAILQIVNNASALSGDMSSYNDEQIEALNDIISQLDASPMLKNVVSGVLSEIALKWTNGEDFMGMEKIDAGATLSPVIDKMLEILATSDKSNIVADLQTVVDVFGVLVEKDILGSADNSQLFLEKIGEEGVVSSLLLKIVQNDRMAPLADEITKIGMRAIASSIGIPQNTEERYDMLMTGLADAFNSDIEDEAEFESEISNTLSSFGVKATEEEVTIITQSMLSDFESIDAVTSESVEEFFIVYAAAKEEAADQNAAVTNGVKIDLLSKDDKDDKKDKDNKKGIVINEDETISVNGRVLKHYNASNLKDSKAYKMGEQNVDIGAASTLHSAQTMESTLITMEDICDKIASYVDCEDVEAEVKMVENVIVGALDSFGSLDLENTTPTELFEKAGELLDLMEAAEIFPEEAVSDLLVGILQSPQVTDTVGISTENATDFAQSLNEMVNTTDQSYSDATKVVAGTINMLNNVGSEKSEEEKKQETKELLENITPESANAISSVVSPSLLENSGIEEDKADAVSNTVNSLLNNMANYEGSDHEGEADAVNTILDFAMNGAHSDDGDVFGENGDGSLGMSADGFIDLVVNSDVVSGTLLDIVRAEGFEVNASLMAQLSEVDSSIISAELEKYYNNHGGGEELREIIEAIASYLNVSVSLG